ncbi:MAG TPA: hypothetical protein DD733_12080 [Clostridiales bacterium]|nr:hypothetical protein [Clostridiales bacterium]
MVYTKQDIIDYAVSEAHLMHTFGENFKKLVKAFRTRQARERENVKRRIKREQARQDKKKST